MKIIFYKNEMFNNVIGLLKECKSYDKIWEKKENLKRKIEKDNESILIAINESEKIIGVIFIMEDGWNAFIWRLCVAVNERKKGIAKKLLEKAEEIIINRGVETISILVNPNNIKLINWYMKKNFKKGKKWTFMYKEINKKNESSKL